MSKKIIKSGDTEVGKREFHSFKDPILFSESDIDKSKISNGVSSGENIYKYFIGYKDDDYEIKVPGIYGSRKILMKVYVRFFFIEV